MLNDTKGTVLGKAGMTYPYALGGALLAELLLAGRLKLEVVKKKTFAAIAGSRLVGEPVLDDCLLAVRDAKRRGTLQKWVERFAHIRRLRQRIALGLCDRGVLREREDTILLFFTRRRYPEQDHRYEQRLVDRLRAAVLEDGEVAARTAIAVALAEAARLLPILFERKTLKARKARVKQIAEGQVIGRSARAAVRAAHQAAMAASAAASVAVIAAASS